MAVGSYDANGVWINGEDDTYATFSARLNKSVQSISDALTIDRGRITALEIPKCLIKYNGGAAAVAWPTALAIVTGISTAALADTSAFTFAAGVFTCVRAGRYRIQAQVATSTVAASVVLYLYQNGAVVKETSIVGGSGSSTTVTIDETLTFAVGNTFDIRNIASAANAGLGGATRNRITVMDV